MEYSLTDIYSRAFGANFIAGRYSNSLEKVVVPTAEMFSTSASKAPVAEFESYIGTPMLMPTKLGTWWLPAEPIVKIGLTRRIIETELDNVDGTFKEGFSNGDFEIDIMGVIIAEGDINGENLPEKNLRTLKRYILQSEGKEKGSIEITNKLINLFGVYNVVIYDFKIDQVPGEIGMLKYSIKAKSDFNRKLIIKGA
jgi:hypothetical protein